MSVKTTDKHRGLRRHIGEHGVEGSRCIDCALKRFGVARCAWPKSLPARAGGPADRAAGQFEGHQNRHTRIIAATHRDLEKRIAADLFREDLYYRLNVFPIRVPPLRERTEDIPMLVWRFVEDFSAASGKRIESISKDNIAMLQRYHWPGNVRELRNLVERAVICANGPRLTIALPQSCAATAARRSVRLFDVEKEHIKGVLESTRWRIRGVGGAADQLGLKATTLETRMAKLGLQRPRL